MRNSRTDVCIMKRCMHKNVAMTGQRVIAAIESNTTLSTFRSTTTGTLHAELNVIANYFGVYQPIWTWISILNKLGGDGIITRNRKYSSSTPNTPSVVLVKLCNNKGGCTRPPVTARLRQYTAARGSGDAHVAWTIERSWLFVIVYLRMSFNTPFSNSPQTNCYIYSWNE